MKNLWNDIEASMFKSPLELRVYTSRLLGAESNLVLHGGGNTSVKTKEIDIFGEKIEVLNVKGSGWDLLTIEKQGFAPVRMDVLLKMVELNFLSDVDMVKYQRAAMLDPNAPNPSVEAILHAIIPYSFVDHTHADSVVAITNTENGEQKIHEIYGDSVTIVPYVMPGFILAKKVYEILKGKKLDSFDGIILLNHGVFTYGNSAKEAYEKMIRIVTKAEDYIEKQKIHFAQDVRVQEPDLFKIAEVRREISRIKKSPMLIRLSEKNTGFASIKNIESLVTRGPLTPDHVIRTKKDGIVIDSIDDIEKYAKNYLEYFNRNDNGKLTCLDLAPRWGILRGIGVISIGTGFEDLIITEDIIEHTIRAIQVSEGLGGFKALSEKEIFEMEYWELEQAKLKKSDTTNEFKGKVALVTGAASGIGRACVEEFAKRGTCVVALDISSNILTVFKNKNVIGIHCDITDEKQIQEALKVTIQKFGGLDIVVSNAGIFPESMKIETMKPNVWNSSLNVNLSSHMQLLKLSIPFLKIGIDPSVIIVASKNVHAPGIGAGAYSVAKAGLTQLARIAALELAPDVRVNILHPDAVFDTGIWTEEILKNRAENYGLSVDEYKKRNLLKSEITSRDIARMACEISGSLFSKVTGAQIPMDGGNDRII